MRTKILTVILSVSANWISAQAVFYNQIRPIPGDEAKALRVYTWTPVVLDSQLFSSNYHEMPKSHDRVWDLTTLETSGAGLTSNNVTLTFDTNDSAQVVPDANYTVCFRNDGYEVHFKKEYYSIHPTKWTYWGRTMGASHRPFDFPGCESWDYDHSRLFSVPGLGIRMPIVGEDEWWVQANYTDLYWEIDSSIRYISHQYRNGNVSVIGDGYLKTNYNDSIRSTLIFEDLIQSWESNGELVERTYRKWTWVCQFVPFPVAVLEEWTGPDSYGINDSTITREFYVRTDLDDDVIGMDDPTIDLISVYPNPTSDVLNVQAASSIEEFSVYDVFGRQVLMGLSDDSEIIIDLSSLRAGLYILKAGGQQKKFIRQ